MVHPQDGPIHEDHSISVPSHDDHMRSYLRTPIWPLRDRKVAMNPCVCMGWSKGLATRNEPRMVASLRLDSFTHAGRPRVTSSLPTVDNSLLLPVRIWIPLPYSCFTCQMASSSTLVRSTVSWDQTVYAAARWLTGTLALATTMMYSLPPHTLNLSTPLLLTHQVIITILPPSNNKKKNDGSPPPLLATVDDRW
jgi:hypothetical protein